MNNLKELIGETVLVDVYVDGEGNTIDVKCKIIGLDIDDYYFQEKGEPIMITVNVEHIGELPEGVDYEDLLHIPLSSIRK
jgi:hypothetical protein